MFKLLSCFPIESEDDTTHSEHTKLNGFDNSSNYILYENGLYHYEKIYIYIYILADRDYLKMTLLCWMHAASKSEALLEILLILVGVQHILLVWLS